MDINIKSDQLVHLHVQLRGEVYKLDVENDIKHQSISQSTITNVIPLPDMPSLGCSNSEANKDRT